MFLAMLNQGPPCRAPPAFGARLGTPVALSTVGAGFHGHAGPASVDRSRDREPRRTPAAPRTAVPSVPRARGAVPSTRDRPPADGVRGGRTRERSGRDKTMQAYCVKCREKRDMEQEKEVTMKNGRNAVEGVCPVCGTKLFRMVGNKDAAQAKKDA
jgi:hypothetical protein